MSGIHGRNQVICATFFAENCLTVKSGIGTSRAIGQKSNTLLSGSRHGGELKTFLNLNYIFSMGAGVDHLKGDPDLPDVPIVRLIDDALTQGMTEYVVQRVLHYHRRQPEFDEQQRGKLWKHLDVPPAWERSVGLMGLGYAGLRRSASTYRA